MGFDRTGETRGQDPVVACPLTSNPYGDHECREGLLVAHSLRAATIGSNADRASGSAPCIAFDTTQMTSKANRSQPKVGDPCHPLAAQAHPPCIAFPERMSGTQCASAENVAPVCAAGARSRGDATTAVMTLAIRGRGDHRELETREDGTANALMTPNGGHDGIGCGAIATQMAVRRLTPLECERLQAFPDNFTNIPFKGKPPCDGVRYRALGNSIATNVLSYIAERIQMVDEIP